MAITLAMLQELAGKKAPVVGIPRQGEKPFAVERARLAGLIEGLENCEISLNSHLEIQAHLRHYVLYCLDMQGDTAAYKLLRSWAARQRAKKEVPKLSRDERRKSELLRKIAIAERKARRLWACRPYNPALEFGGAASDYEREQWAAWVPAYACLNVSFKLIQGHLDGLAVSLPDSSVSTYEGCDRNTFGGTKRRIPPRTMLGCFVLFALLVFGLWLEAVPD